VKGRKDSSYDRLLLAGEIQREGGNNTRGKKTMNMEQQQQRRRRQTYRNEGKTEETK
jgi:hypothetical protein